MGKHFYLRIWDFIFGFITLKIWTILNIFILKFGVYFWVHCIEDMDNS
jgi:hypothetical protein